MKEIRARAALFAAEWAGSTYEIGDTQSFWNDFLAIFGIDRRRVAFFEKRAARLSTGNRGRIDMFWPGMLLVEQKSAGLDLDKAEDQAFDYLAGLSAEEFPNAVVVSDFAHIRLTRFDKGGRAETQLIETKNLEKEIDRFAFLAGYVKRDYTRAEEEIVNGKAVKLMGQLYTEISGDHFSDHETSVFMTRTLFLLFGDDTGLWPRGLFQDLLEHSREDGDSLGGTLDTLFTTLNRPEKMRSPRLSEDIQPFPYVNGGLFSEHIEIPPFDASMRQALIACSQFDWGAISPAVFGSMFQVVKSRLERRALGEHYTSETNILKTINPLFMDGLRAQFVRAHGNVDKLRTLQKQLGTMTFLDPACGCGNFLVVAYRDMRALELDILLAIRDVTNNEVLADYEAADDLQVSQSQFFGIEIEEWPAKIAETAMFLVDHQANLRLSQEFGRAPDRLPISEAATIRIDNALRIDWAELVPATDNTIVLGNPPFVGMARMDGQQQEDNRIAFMDLPEARGQRSGRLDYVGAWYGKALAYTRGTSARTAFVSTNSIAQGDQARAMDPMLRAAGYAVDFGHRTFRWTSEAANAAVVYCTIIGFSRIGTVKQKRLFDYPDINGQPIEVHPKALDFYLIDSDQPAPAKRRRPLVAGLPAMIKGSQPTDGGGLIVEPEDYDAVMADPIAAKYIRPFLQAQNMLHGDARWCLWLTDVTPSDIASSPELQRRLALVTAARAQSPTPSVVTAAGTPALFTQIRQPTTSWLAVPFHSSENRDYIPMAYYDATSIAGNGVGHIEGAPLWIFAFLQSKAFTMWVRTFSGALKGDFRISPDLTYSVFPLVKPSGTALTKMEAAARAVLDARALFPAESLATLYGKLSMPVVLRRAHDHLDTLVDGVYGMTKPTDARRAQILLAKHHELVDAELLVTSAPVARRTL
ncbi:hypothetical protein RCH16_003179 [Cryobacterium sp. MP_M5]|uniref:class I SAM-dependent DNA methyltransferase n=1 Tax=unclassified Cryobacterium TaxID=2649013 RepID=UPI0018CB6CE9|nr:MULTISPECIES: class I SAM-dependent DNA methyltransferase [unclassified Cryobacterium]MBG6059773.1 hypothetical protein [Cryobacterium sp. MP_M3]MEC5178148.1 hypothetical protein [Cryobacterium sp. MP_M5]